MSQRCAKKGWFKSTFSAPTSENCVEVRFVVQVRDSKVHDGSVLEFSRAEWEAFLLGAHNREFDLT